jgi:phosphoglycerate dehydrogenase-like enzyme
MHAVLHYRASHQLAARLQTVAPSWLTTTTIAETDLDGLPAALCDADVLLHVLTPATRELLALAPHLKLIQKIGVGINTIDLAAAKARGIRVANMPGTNSQAVCEMTLALMLAALRQLVPFDRATRAGLGWELPLAALDAQREIHGKTVGLVGYGEVAQRLTPVLQALGAEVIYHARHERPAAGAPFVTFDELLRHSDIISLHLPLVPGTEGLFGETQFRAVKPGVVLVNTARGGLIDETALLAALRRGQVGAAGLDVFAAEPITAAIPLFEFPNVVVMPHLAWLTNETLARSFDVAIENCRRLRDHEPLLHEITL